MKNFNINRFKALLAYDFATTKKSLALCYGITLLVFAAFCTVTYQINKQDWDGNIPYDLFFHASEVLGICSHFGFIFWCTAMLLRQKYSKPNFGIGYTMLPASTLEKGLTIFLEYFVFTVIGAILIYVVAYSGVWMAMNWITEESEMTYEPFYFISNWYHSLYDEPIVVHTDVEEVGLITMLYFMFMLPVTLFLHFMLYLVFNLMFKNNGQVKSLGLLAAIDIAVMLGTIFYTLYIAHINRTPDDPDAGEKALLVWVLYPSLVLITLQVPAAAALVWHFFRRLRTKEIR